MNIFYLDDNSQTCAEMHCDKHVVKMIVEYAQLMSTAHRVLDGTVYYEKTKNNRAIKRYMLDDNRQECVYKASHVNHPQNVWVRQSDIHYKWLYRMWLHLCNEYTYRYGKVHSTYTKLKDVLKKLPNNIKFADGNLPPLTMPDDVKSKCHVQSYRNFYIVHKREFAKWTKRKKPEWMI